MATTETTTAYLEAFEASRRDEPKWLAAQRRLAVERFSLLGFPTPRHEEYKYTSLKALAAKPFGPAAGDAPAADLSRVDYAGDEVARLVFVDGRLTGGASETSPVRVESIAQRLENDPASLEGHLTRYADFESHALTALNTAFFEDGAVVEIPAKAIVDKPVHLVWISTGEVGTVSHPRTLILAGAQSQATVVESFISLTDGAAWTNAATEIVAEEAARVDHFAVQQESTAAHHTGLVQMLAERNAYISTISLSFGAALARNDVNIRMNGEGAECALDGLFYVRGKQHVDHHTTIEHAVAHCNSHQLYKGVLDDEARGVFNGKILVRRHAQKTDAIQNNQNLLLSRKAEIDTKPQLEIDADDVRCTHGATIGQLDKDALFYLQSRGIPRAEARALLTYAFAADLLERIRLEPLRDHFEQKLMEELAADPETEVFHR